MRVEETGYASPSQMDFVPREQRNKRQNLTAAALMVAAAILLLHYVPGLRDSFLSPLLSVALISGFCAYLIYHYQQALDLVMHTEYQNLLFAQGMVLGSAFCLIVKKDGSVAYASDGLREITGTGDYGSHNALESLFTRGQVAPSDRERIMGIIYNGGRDRIVFPLLLPDGSPKTYILTLEPMTRPAGFLLIRGREYRDSREGTQMLPDMLRSTSADKLDHMLATTPVAHFTTDAFGHFEYVNQAFETCLGYMPGEVLANRTSLTQSLKFLAGMPLEDDYTIADFAGHASFATKAGELVDCLLFQSLMRDERGKPTGLTGSIVIANIL